MKVLRDALSRLRQLGPEEWVFWGALAASLPFALAPLFAARILPGLDLGFHLAIVDALHKVEIPGTPHAALYDARFGIKPYALYYGVMYLLSKIWAINTAHKILMVAYVMTLPLTTAALLRALGRSPLPALLTLPLAYNMNLHYGFVSYCVSIPVTIGYFAATAHLLRRDPPRRVYFLVAVLGMALFFAHAQTFVLGMLGGGLLVAVGAPSWRRRWLYLATLAPLVALFVVWQSRGIFSSAPAGATKDFAYSLRQAWQQRAGEAAGAGRGELTELYERLGPGLRSQALRGFRDQSDWDIVNVWVVALALYLVLALALTLLRDRQQLAGRFGRWSIGVIPLLAVVALYLALPHHTADLNTIYPRFAVVLLMLLPLLIPSGLTGHSLLRTIGCVVPALIVVAWTSLSITRHYRQYGEEMKDFRAVMRQAPPNKKLIGIFFRRHSDVMINESVWASLASFYPLLRPGPQSFVHVYYCTAAQVPCALKDATKKPPDPGPWGRPVIATPEAYAYYDLFLVATHAGAPPPLATPGLKLRAHTGRWYLYEKPEKPGAAK